MTPAEDPELFRSLSVIVGTGGQTSYIEDFNAFESDWAYEVDPQGTLELQLLEVGHASGIV